MSAPAFPAYLAITPPSSDDTGDDTGAAWQRAVCAQLPVLSEVWAGTVGLQLRPLRPIPVPVWQRVLAEAAALNLPVWLNTAAPTIQALNATECGSFGIHLNHPRLMAATRAEVAAMQAQGGRVSAACHDAAALARAEALGVDAVLISPVLPTASHPGAPVLGWAGFADLARRTALPVFGLGGLAPSDLPTLRAQGGYGVAGIGAFFEPDFLQHSVS